MAAKMKGIYRGLKFISQIFAVKEREMEIGSPTDVKHVAHIGWDGSSGTAPSWMNEYKTAPDFATTSLGSVSETRHQNSNSFSTWSSQDFELSMGGLQATKTFKDSPTIDIPNIPKKHKRKKSKSTSSPKSSSSSRHTRASSKSKALIIDMEATPSMQMKTA